MYVSQVMGSPLESPCLTFKILKTGPTDQTSGGPFRVFLHEHMLRV